MAKNVLLISEKEIKTQSIIEQNVDGKLLSKVIRNVQETQLKQILGNVLYNQVVDEVFAQAKDGVPVSAGVKTLLDDYIVPFLTFATVTDFIVINNYKVTNKGTLKLNDNAGQSVNSSELEYAKNYYENYTATYKKMLIDFLADNDLDTPGTDKDTTSTGIGWFLDGDYTPSNSGGGSKLEINENDPIWANEKVYYYTKEEVDAAVSAIQLAAADWLTLQNKPTAFPAAPHNHDDRYYTEAEVNSLLAGKQNAGNYLTSFTETDPVFRASVAYGITSANITNWNAAYSWGNHALAGYLKALPAHTHAIGEITGLQTALDDKSSFDHTHTFDQITSSGATKNNLTVYNSAAGNGSAYLTIAGGSGWLGLNNASGTTTRYMTDRISINGSDFMLPTSVTLGNAGTIALVSQIPTNNNQLANGAGYISKAQADTYYAAIGDGGSTYTVSNGLTLSGSDIQLGGSLAGNTTIATGNLGFYLTGQKNIIVYDEMLLYRGYFDFVGNIISMRVEGWGTGYTFENGVFQDYTAMTAKDRTSETIYSQVKVSEVGIELTGKTTASSDIEVTDLTKGVILKSPDGSRFRVTIDNSGALTSTKL